MVFLCFIDYNIDHFLFRIFFSSYLRDCSLLWLLASMESTFLMGFSSIGLLGLASLGSISLMDFSSVSTYLMGLLYEVESL